MPKFRTRTTGSSRQRGQVYPVGSGSIRGASRSTKYRPPNKDWVERDGELHIRVTAEYPSAAERIANEKLRELDESGSLSANYFERQPYVGATDSRNRRWVVFKASD